eukprot:Cvel_20679.t1-p1 / transcript=Cvel_20679.t1 / gene=Cvel_20679 / organism=Chromera_velia_CCMP2878 / gene_product=hypothetical protein / transcript_product=hypothetical protein / location=Cvel_scaffold1879:30320-34615(-) / protein_length=512 / sequence_SO=supercontig / SO=protein_coding / is_pseudo=false
MGRLGSSLSLTSFAMLGSSLSVASFGRFGSGLTVNGNLYVTGNISYGGTLQDGTNTSCGTFGSSSCASDRRLKHAIRNLKEWRSDDWQNVSSSSSMRKEGPSPVHQEDRSQSEGALLRYSPKVQPFRSPEEETQKLRRLQSSDLQQDRGDLLARAGGESSSDPLSRETVEGRQTQRGPASSISDVLERLEPVAFRWREGTNEASIETLRGENFGFIAQEVREVLPSLVSENHEGKLRLRYQDFSAIAVAGLKEQRRELERQQKEIDTQKTQMEDRKKELDEQKKALAEEKEAVRKELAQQKKALEEQSQELAAIRSLLLSQGGYAKSSLVVSRERPAKSIEEERIRGESEKETVQTVGHQGENRESIETYEGEGGSLGVTQASTSTSSPSQEVLQAEDSSASVFDRLPSHSSQQERTWLLLSDPVRREMINLERPNGLEGGVVFERGGVQGGRGEDDLIRSRGEKGVEEEGDLRERFSEEQWTSGDSRFSESRGRAGEEERAPPEPPLTLLE